MNIVWSTALILLSMMSALTSQIPATVRLTVKHDECVQPGPDYVTLSIKGQSQRISVHEGRFTVPAEFIAASAVTFVAEVGADHIQIPNLPGVKFTVEDWTILLADRKYDKDYEGSVPKGTVVSSSCIVVFDSASSGMATQAFVPNCRGKRGRQYGG